MQIYKTDLFVLFFVTDIFGKMVILSKYLEMCWFYPITTFSNIIYFLVNKTFMCRCILADLQNLMVLLRHMSGVFIHQNSWTML